MGRNSMKNHNKKAQIVSNDLIVAVLIILVIVGALSAILVEYLNFEQQRAENRDLELKGQGAISTLTSTSGSPSNWEE
jgi:Tfp pilus assembly protein PilV